MMKYFGCAVPTGFFLVALAYICNYASCDHDHVYNPVYAWDSNCRDIGPFPEGSVIYEGGEKVGVVEKRGIRFTTSPPSILTVDVTLHYTAMHRTRSWEDYWQSKTIGKVIIQKDNYFLYYSMKLKETRAGLDGVRLLIKEYREAEKSIEEERKRKAIQHWNDEIITLQKKISDLERK